MHSEMAFECLLVSHDPAVFGTMDRILRDLSIRTNVCPNASIAANLLTDGDTDLVVIDLESKHSAELIRQIHESGMRQKPTVLAVSTGDCSIPGVHVILRKPVTAESGARSLKAAYSRMLQDYRKFTRFALMTPVVAGDENSRTFSLTVANVGEGGVGLISSKKLPHWEHLVFSGSIARTRKRNSHSGSCCMDSAIRGGGLRVRPHCSRRPARSAHVA